MVKKIKLSVILLLLATLVILPVQAVKVSKFSSQHLEAERIVNAKFRIYRLDGSIIEIEKRIESQEFTKLMEMLKRQYVKRILISLLI